jgi:4-amino-4-deoxy-L-arabinose transferase-like glycosyltransferase
MNDNADNAKLFRIALAVVLAVTLIRVVVLILSPLNLYPDEAQYWWWAQSPSFGYFSKPPLIAFLVWLTTAIFGNAEWAIRLASPFLHGATALVLFGIARQIYPANPRVAFWSATSYLTLPGISYSSGLISTDVPLLFFWAVALYAFLRARDGASWRWPLLCGVAIGFGLLSKYAMLYFVLGAVVAAFFSAPVRRLVLSIKGLAIVLVAAAIFSPNIFWNAAHGFPTVAHTEANANWGHAKYSIGTFAGFVLGQFGVFGPVLMIALLAGFWRTLRGQDEAERILMAFSLPPLILILIQAFISEANANWAAATYVAATPLAVNQLVLWGRRWPLGLSVAIGVIVMVLLWIILIAPPFADRIGVGNAFKRLEGWNELGLAVQRQAARADYDAVAAENRSVVAELLYYARPLDARIRIWDRDTKDTNHFEMTMRLTPPAPHVLLVVEPDAATSVLSTFESAAALETVSTPIGGHRTRVLRLYDARNYFGPQKLP